MELSRWNDKRQVSKLHKHIKSACMVKTILDPEKSIDLRSFYCTSHYQKSTPSKKSPRIKLEKLEDLPSRHVVIQGIAGQGKSILLRYICSKELESCTRIPVFIELRKITKEKSLASRLSETFMDFGLSYSEEGFCALYDADKICLLLDGFDEVDEDVKRQLIWDLETLARRFPSLHVVITARPDSEICKSSPFEVVNLCEMIGEEYKIVISKLLPEDPIVAELLKAIKEHKNDITHLLKTPLLVTLLTITYKSFERIPEQLSEFYEAVFHALVWRHDQLKPGFRRTRKSGLTDTDFRNLFEAFCYYIKEGSKNSYTEAFTKATADRVITQSKIAAKADPFIDDVTKTTCLLARDGLEYRFLHRSIQEFFAASYLSKRPTATLFKFYRTIIEKDNSHFSGEIAFLEAIDQFRYIDGYALPSLAIFLNIDVGALKILQRRELREKIKTRTLALPVDILCTDGACVGIAFPKARFGLLQAWYSDLTFSFEPTVDFQKNMRMSQLINDNLSAVYFFDGPISVSGAMNYAKVGPYSIAVHDDATMGREMVTGVLRSNIAAIEIPIKQFDQKLDACADRHYNYIEKIRNAENEDLSSIVSME